MPTVLPSTSRFSGKRINMLHSIRERELKRGDELTKAEGNPQAAYFTPTLVNICAKVFANTFETQSSIEELPDELRQLVIEQLSTDLPLKVAVQRVRNQEYWQARCEDNWTSGLLSECVESKKGGDVDWKRVFLQRHLEEKMMEIDTAQPSDLVRAEIQQLCLLSAASATSLNLSRLRCHFDLHELFSWLPQLRELRLTYGVLNAGMEFELKMFGMHDTDAMSLRDALRLPTTNLTTLKLPENRIDDNLLRGILSGLVKNTTVTHIDLSHNKIEDGGAKVLATILMRSEPPQQLKILNLSDNLIRSAGAVDLGRAIENNSKLTHLHLKLNRFGDDGGRVFAEALRVNTTLKVLDLDHNDLGSDTARVLAEALKANAKLVTLNLSGNDFQEEGGRLIREGVDNNSNLTTMDLRGSGVSEADADAVQEVLERRIQSQRQKVEEEAERLAKKKIDEALVDKMRKLYVS
eukprot:PhM_4_TR9423/c0_g1_i1/m.67352